MAQITPISSLLRLTSDNTERIVCTISNVAPNVSANTAFGFAKAVEQLYNDGPCSIRLNTAVEIVE